MQIEVHGRDTVTILDIDTMNARALNSEEPKLSHMKGNAKYITT